MDKKTRKLLDECWAALEEFERQNKELKRLSNEIDKVLNDR